VTWRLRDRGIALIRAAGVSVLIGHWLADLLFDPHQYASGAQKLLGELNDPIYAQTILAAVAFVALTRWGKRRERTGAPLLLGGASRLRLLGVLLAADVILFLGLEATERTAIGLMSGRATGVGALGAGFMTELLVAVGGALLLALLGVATVRIVRHLTARARVIRAIRPRVFVPQRSRRLPLVLAGTGGVRAPPRP